MKKIAIYTIVKNQSRFVKNWIERAVEADGIFVLDMGSTDMTVENLKKTKALIGNYKGSTIRYDEARKQALDMIPADYDMCMACDINDILPYGWTRLVRKKMKPGIDIMSYVRRTYFYNRIETDVARKWIHKRDLKFQWKYPIHEDFEAIDVNMKCNMVQSGLILSGYGNIFDRRPDNLFLLELGLGEKVHHEKMLHHLAIEHMINGDYEKAKLIFREHAEISTAYHEKSESMRYIAFLTEDFAEKIDWLRQAVCINPYRKDHWIDLSLAYCNIRDWENVVLSCRKALLLGNNTEYINYRLHRDSIPYELYAFAAFQLKKYKLAFQYGKKALKEDADDERFLKNLSVYEKFYWKNRLFNKFIFKPGHMEVGENDCVQAHIEKTCTDVYYKRHTEEHLGLFRENREKLYCTIPFRHLILAANGIKCCTWLYELEGWNYVPAWKYKDLANIWNDTTMQRVRRSIRDGSYSQCDLAHCPEVRGARRYMMPLREIREKFPAIADFLEGKTDQYETVPDFVNIGNDSTCNLNCPSCCRHDLPQSDRNDKYGQLNSLNVFGTGLKTIFLSGMGEPFFSPVYMDWIMKFRKKNFPNLEVISINTNGQLLTRELWEKLPENFKTYVKKITISVDGATRDTYEKNRRGGSFEILLKNMNMLKELRERNCICHLRLYYVYQLNNYKEMPELIRLARRFSFDTVFFARISNWGSFHERIYKKIDIGNPQHPRGKSFRNVVKKIDTLKMQNPKPDIFLMT